MVINVAINGFGRIGRMIFRAAFHDKKINVIAINDLTDTKTLAHLLKFDSVHGKFNQKINSTKDSIIVGNKKIRVFAQKDPSQLPWKDLKIDVVAECTGFFRTYESSGKHLEAGAKKVIISADAKGEGVKTIVMGVNHNEYNKNKDHILSNASCTTNCTAPVIKVLNDNFKIIDAFFTTTHAYTSTQKLHDSPDHNLRNARASAVNIIPHSSGAAIAVPLVVPEVKNHLAGMALRVPVIDGSITVITAHVKNKTTINEVNLAFKTAAKKMKGFLEYSNLPLVSSDIIGNPHSSIFDSEYTCVQGNLIQVLSWYDNEWGYSNRMVDMIKILL